MDVVDNVEDSLASGGESAIVSGPMVVDVDLDIAAGMEPEHAAGRVCLVQEFNESVAKKSGVLFPTADRSFPLATSRNISPKKVVF